MYEALSEKDTDTKGPRNRTQVQYWVGGGHDADSLRPHTELQQSCNRAATEVIGGGHDADS